MEREVAKGEESSDDDQQMRFELGDEMRYKVMHSIFER